MDIDEHLDCQPILITFATCRQPAPFPSFQIVFKLSCMFTLSRWDLQHLDALDALVSEHALPPACTVVPMTLGDFICYNRAHAIINECTRDWPAPGADRQEFIDLTLGVGRIVVGAMEASDNYVFVHMRMNSYLNQVFDEVRMVPAGGSAVESLAAVAVASESCTVCLEEFAGREGFRCRVRMFSIVVASRVGLGLATFALVVVLRCQLCRFN